MGGDYWLRHFEAYLQTQRLLSDLFTVVAVFGLVAVATALFFSSRPRRQTIVVACCVLALLGLIGGAYALVGAQFRHGVLNATEALAVTLLTYPGATPAGARTWPDYRTADSPPQAALSFTRLAPRAWNYASGFYFRPPLGTNGRELWRYLAPRFEGWRKVADIDDTVVYERRKATVQVDVWKKGDGTVDRCAFIVNAWRPDLQ